MRLIISGTRIPDAAEMVIDLLEGKGPAKRQSA
jgi:hypothetical protein